MEIPYYFWVLINYGKFTLRELGTIFNNIWKINFLMLNNKLEIYIQFNKIQKYNMEKENKKIILLS